jgi:hypothetical protein
MDLDFTETFCHPRKAYNVGTEDIRPGRGEARLVTVVFSSGVGIAGLIWV